MDPDDMPTIVQLHRCRCSKTEKDFRDKFVNEICEHHLDLPLDRFCNNGGCFTDVEDDEVEVAEFTKTHVKGTYTCTFNEEYYGGCRDITFTERHTATLYFFFERRTGELRLSGGYARREYDPEEF
jgi:hypothetical protein